MNVTDTATDEHLLGLDAGVSHSGSTSVFPATDDQRLAALQDALKCGTSCGPCLPQLKRRVRSSRSATKSPDAQQQPVIPNRQIA
jgi:assimilatory nitrate reductase catalytic subunit